MWNEEELLAEIDAYYDSITEEKFLADLQEAGCIEYIEDVSASISNIKYSSNKNNCVVRVSVTNEVKVGERFNSLVLGFNNSKNRVIKGQTFNSYIEEFNKLSIGA